MTEPTVIIQPETARATQEAVKRLMAAVAAEANNLGGVNPLQMKLDLSVMTARVTALEEMLTKAKAKGPRITVETLTQCFNKHVNRYAEVIEGNLEKPKLVTATGAPLGKP